MTARRRVALAFGSFLFGFGLFAVVGILPTTIRWGPRYAVQALEMMPVYLMFALVGLLLAMPFVLLIRNAEGAKSWILLGIGTCLGPAFLITWMLLASHGHFSWRTDGLPLMMSVEIGFPTTLLYIALLRRWGGQRGSGVEGQAREG